VTGDPLTSAFSRGSVETSVCGEANDIGEMSYHPVRVRRRAQAPLLFRRSRLLILALTACYLLSCGTRPACFPGWRSPDTILIVSQVCWRFVWVRSPRSRFAAPPLLQSSKALAKSGRPTTAHGPSALGSIAHPSRLRSKTPYSILGRAKHTGETGLRNEAPPEPRKICTLADQCAS